MTSKGSLALPRPRSRRGLAGGVWSVRARDALLRLLRPADSCTYTGMNALLLMHSARLVTSHTDRMSLSS